MGVKNPDRLNEMCRRERIDCVNIDLPGATLSVVSDNHQGAFILTERLIREMGG